MTTDRPMGLITDMPFEDYHAVDALSASGMRHLARSPWHFRHRVDTKPTRPMLRGTLAHCAVLEPDAVSARYVYVPDDAPRRPTAAQWAAKNSNADSVTAKEWWTRFNASVEGREIVPAADMALLREQLAAIEAEPELAGILSGGQGELSLFWSDAATGVYCKARLDWINGVRQPEILELKTTADESPSGFGRIAARMGYHLQRAHYVAGYEAVTGRKVGRFVFGAVTSTAPVLAMPYELTDEIVDQANDEREELLGIYAHCLATGDWPRYGGHGTHLLDFPAYAKRSAEVEVGWAE